MPQVRAVCRTLKIALPTVSADNARARSLTHRPRQFPAASPSTLAAELFGICAVSKSMPDNAATPLAAPMTPRQVAPVPSLRVLVRMPRATLAARPPRRVLKIRRMSGTMR